MSDFLDSMPKHYTPAEVEPRVYQAWRDADAFAAVPDARDQRYVIMMPLPNITGALHMGHAMDNVMQDLLIRFHRQRGSNVLWQPGTDHAGIATQAVVEKRLFELEGKTRHDVGREGLVERIFDWKDQYQARIFRQLESMGCSCDWDRKRFTMDPVCARAVREAFFRLFQDGLIFRGDRLVNLDCHLQTAVADDELETKDVAGHFWHLKYPLVDPQPGEPDHVVVATTRPETMLGDTAVACHPEPRKVLEARLEEAKAKLSDAKADEAEAIQAEVARLEARFESHLPTLEVLAKMARDGRKVQLPLQDRPIPLVLDEWAKPELGSGCVKITPCHDENDYEVSKRHPDEIGLINILNLDGTLNEKAGSYQGLDRFEARKKVVADLDAQGLLLEIEDRVIPIKHSDRSKTPIEPFLSKQWFVHMADVEGGLTMGQGTAKEHQAKGLAQAAMDAVDPGYSSPSGLNLTFYPDRERYSKIYLAWLEEKRDWCISRQLWWGHRIPIWMAEVSVDQAQELSQALSEALAEDRYFLSFSDEFGRRFQASELPGKDGRFEAQLCLRAEADDEGAQAILERFQLVQDPDVLDTWFSSALWPFSTLGWPDPETAAIDPGDRSLVADGDAPASLDYYYPGSCLVTGRDIITLWVARMTLMGLYLLGDIPFYHSFIHANIQDGKGERMSKSKGNGIDPVDIIDRYGTDALRFVLAEMQTGTQDIRLPVKADSPFTGKAVDLGTAEHGRTIFTYLCPETGKEFDVLGTMEDLPKVKPYSDRFEIGKSFCTKLWNASRFVFSTLEEGDFSPVALTDLELEDRWVLSRLKKASAKVEAGLLAYSPSTALGAARDFFWNDLCDWYVELVKGRIKDGRSPEVAKTVLGYVLDVTLRLLHPFVPFISEEIWSKFEKVRPTRGLVEALEVPTLLSEAQAVAIPEIPQEEEAEQEFALVQELVRSFRDLRARHQVSPKKPLPASIQGGLELSKAALATVQQQAYLETLDAGPEAKAPEHAARAILKDLEVCLGGVLDPEKERARLSTQKQKLEKEIASVQGKLGNEKFVARAPEAVVAAAKQQLADAENSLRSVQEGLDRLG